MAKCPRCQTMVPVVSDELKRQKMKLKVNFHNGQPQYNFLPSLRNVVSRRGEADEED